MPPGIPLACSSNELSSRMLDILDQLVGFDTTSRKSNLELITYVRDLLSGNGIDSQLHWNQDREKASLTATAGSPRDGRRGIIWSGHTDTVPVDGQAWTSDPFKLQVADGAAIGRGTADMKGFIACCLAILSAVATDSLTTPISLLLTYDEEVGCVGARQLTPELKTWAGHAVGCIVGEPTGLNVVVGHKGKQNHRVRFSGEARHAALAPTAANPITTASELAVFASSLNERFQTQGPHDERFEITHSWINVGRIDGGVKPNIVPDTCTVELEIRAIPGHSCEGIARELETYAAGTLLERMRNRTTSASATWEQLSDTPYFAMDEKHPFIEMITPVLTPTTPTEWVPFGTEAGLLWGHAGIPTAVWGPGSITQAHTPDESVPLSQLRDCLAGLQKIHAL